MKAEQFEQIMKNISEKGMSLRKACAKEGFKSVNSVYEYFDKDGEVEKKKRTEQYARACEIRQDFLFDEILDISDDSVDDLLGVNEHGHRMENKEFVNRSKLRVDARKWALSKMNPKKYGDKVDLGVGDLPKDSKVSINLSLGSSDEDA